MSVVGAAYSPDLMENLVDTVCDSINCDPVEFAINVTEDGKVSVTKPQDGRATTDTARDQSARRYFAPAVRKLSLQP